MEEKILFSILVPVYNVERYIENCLNSIINQKYTNYEVILIDDGSTDASGKLCDKYSKNDSRFITIHQRNGGLMHARRVALQIAKGDYYLFLDSDDTFKDNTLQVIYNYLQKYKCDCLVYGMDRVYEGCVIEKFKSEFPEEVIFEKKTDIYLNFFIHSNLNAMWRKAVKATVFQMWDYSQYYGISCGEDLLQSIEIYKNCNTIAVIPIALYNYTFNPNSITQTISLKNYKIDFIVRSTVLKFIYQEKCFTDKEYRIYRTFCNQLLCEEIKRICLLTDEYKTLVTLFKQIKESEYYNSFLVGDINEGRLGKMDLFLLNCFHKQKYYILFCLGISKKIHQKIKRRKKNDVRGA